MRTNAVKNIGSHVVGIATAFLIMCNSILNVCVSFILQRLVNTAVKGNSYELVLCFKYAIVYLLVVYLVTTISTYLSNKYVLKQSNTLRNLLLQKILDMPVNEYQRLGIGNTISLFENDIVLLETNYFGAKLDVISFLSTFVFGLISMFIINCKIAIVVILTSLIPVIFSYLYARSLRCLQNAYSDSHRVYTTALKNVLSNFGLIKLFHIESKIEDQVFSQSYNQSNCKSKYLIRSELTSKYTGLCGVIVVIVIFFVGTLLIVKGDTQVGALLAFIQLTNYVLTPIEGISLQLNHIKSCRDIVQKIDNILQKELHENAAKELFPEDSSITLSNIKYKYGEKEVLKQISLSFHKGKRYAIIGNSGSGKSTLLRILSRFYEEYDGEIFYGNINSREIDLESFYSNVIMLQQDVLILNDTVRNNILLYRDQTDEAKVSKLLRELRLEELYTSKSICLDNGDNLSGGEKQRIAMARALLRMPKILLLDESFSAVDQSMRFTMEKRVLKSADIVISVTHDRTLEHLRKYDEIIYLDDGCVIAKGPIDEIANVLTLTQS